MVAPTTTTTTTTPPGSAPPSPGIAGADATSSPSSSPIKKRKKRKKIVFVNPLNPNSKAKLKKKKKRSRSKSPAPEDSTKNKPTTTTTTTTGAAASISTDAESSSIFTIRRSIVSLGSPKKQNKGLLLQDKNNKDDSNNNNNNTNEEDNITDKEEEKRKKAETKKAAAKEKKELAENKKRIKQQAKENKKREKQHLPKFSIVGRIKGIVKNHHQHRKRKSTNGDGASSSYQKDYDPLNPPTDSMPPRGVGGLLDPEIMAKVVEADEMGDEEDDQFDENAIGLNTSLDRDRKRRSVTGDQPDGDDAEAGENENDDDDDDDDDDDESDAPVQVKGPISLILLLVDPESLRFELLQLEFETPQHATVKDVLTQIAASVTEPTIQILKFVGVMDRAGRSFTAGHALGEALTKRRGSKDILVVMSKGITTEQCGRLARPILGDEQVTGMLQIHGYEVAGWAKDKNTQSRITDSQKKNKNDLYRQQQMIYMALAAIAFVFILLIYIVFRRYFFGSTKGGAAPVPAPPITENLFNDTTTTFNATFIGPLGEHVEFGPEEMPMHNVPNDPLLQQEEACDDPSGPEMDNGEVDPDNQTDAESNEVASEKTKRKKKRRKQKRPKPEDFILSVDDSNSSMEEGEGVEQDQNITNDGIIQNQDDEDKEENEDVDEYEYDEDEDNLEEDDDDEYDHDDDDYEDEEEDEEEDDDDKALDGNAEGEQDGNGIDWVAHAQTIAKNSKALVAYIHNYIFTFLFGSKEQEKQGWITYMLFGKSEKELEEAAKKQGWISYLIFGSPNTKKKKKQGWISYLVFGSNKKKKQQQQQQQIQQQKQGWISYLIFGAKKEPEPKRSWFSYLKLIF